MGDSITHGELKQNTNNTWFLDEYDCTLCLNGGKCRNTGYTTTPQCLCADGYTGKRCHLTELIDFNVSPKENSGTTGLATGLTVGICFLVLIAVVAFFLWRKRHTNEKNKEKEVQTNRMKKMSIEGLSIIGDRPTIKRTAIPVCIAIEEENSSHQEHLTLSLEDNNSYTNPLNSHKEGRGQDSSNSDALV